MFSSFFVYRTDNERKLKKKQQKQYLNDLKLYLYCPQNIQYI